MSLTEGIDTATANIFNSTNKFFAGTGYVNTLNDNDTLTGTGTNPTLNVQLGASNDIDEDMVIQPTLNGVETVNIEFINSGDSEAELNLMDAMGVENVNITRITQNSAEVSVTDMAAEVTNLSLSNATRDANVTFDYREEVLTETESMNLGMSSVRLNQLNLVEGGDANDLADQGHFFETVNVTVAGTTGADVDRFTIAANEAGKTQTVDLTANSRTEFNNFNISGAEVFNITANAQVWIDQSVNGVTILEDASLQSADLDSATFDSAARITIDGMDGVAADGDLTVDASAMTGALHLGLTAAADANTSGFPATRNDIDLTLTSGSGDDVIVAHTSLAGSITTNDGADAVTVAGNMEGVSTINTGEGNDSVTVQDMLGTAEDFNEENNNQITLRAAMIDTGAGDDTVVAASLLNTRDWDNKVLTDANEDDTYVVVGSEIATGEGNDSVTVDFVFEGSEVSTGAGNDTFNVSLSNGFATILEGDTDADVTAIVPGAGARTREVNADGTVNRLGAVVDLGAGDDVANFTEVDPDLDAYTIVGRDAELRGGDGADVLNVTGLDDITVAARNTGVNDQNATILGFETINLTIQNQIDAQTEADVAGVVENDDDETDGLISLDVQRVDSDLAQINLVSQEAVLLRNAATELYEAGTDTTFELSNLRSGIDVTLSANEATGVDAFSGQLRDDNLLTINATTGAVNANGLDGAVATDVNLNVDMIATGAADTFTLDINAGTQAFDLALGMYRTNEADTGAAVGTADTTANRVENVVINFADASAHSVDMRGFGDNDFVALAANGTNAAVTSFTLNSAAAAGTGLAVNNVNADTIRFNNADGTAVTAANVTLRVDAENNYNIVTGSGTDIIDMRADTVRAFNTVTGQGADTINAGAARDVLIVDGANDLGTNNKAGVNQSSTVVNDDVFNTLSGIETVLVDSADGAGNQQMITLDEAAKATMVDTLRFVGNAAQSTHLVIGNNFEINGTPANGQLTTADNALVVDASLMAQSMTLDIESKDDDTDIQYVNMDIRANAGNGVYEGAAVNVLNSGDQSGRVELRLTTSSQVEDTVTPNSNATTVAVGAVAVDKVAVEVTVGSIDKIVMVEGSADTDTNTAGVQAVESTTRDTYTIDASWTQVDGTFEYDASALTDTDADADTGGATITVNVADTATFTLRGTQNSDDITGGSRADSIFGNAGNDTINGLAGADVIDGGTGDDLIDGGTGADTINGGEGDDVIIGGLGADNLTGGAGADTFRITAVNESIQSSADTITDFATGTDTIDITNMTVAGNGVDAEVINLGRFAVVANAADGDNSLDGTTPTREKFDAFYSTTGMLAIDVDGDGDITDVNDIVINSTGAINAADIDYTINITGAQANIVRMGQGEEDITTAGDSTFVIVGSLDAAQVAHYNTATADGTNFNLIANADVQRVVNINDLLTVRAASEANAGDSITANGANDTLHIYGNVDLTVVNLNGSIETLVVHSSVQLTIAQLQALTTIQFFGSEAHTLVITNNDGIPLTAAQQAQALGTSGVVIENAGTGDVTFAGMTYGDASALAGALALVYRTATDVVAARAATYANAVEALADFDAANPDVAAVLTAAQADLTAAQAALTVARATASDAVLAANVVIAQNALNTDVTANGDDAAVASALNDAEDAKDLTALALSDAQDAKDVTALALSDACNGLIISDRKIA